MSKHKISLAVLKRAKNVRLLLMDVDGVLTDGGIWLMASPGGGLVEAKCFNSLDGAGLVQIRQAGIETGVITKRSSEALARRARELSMAFVFQGVEVKLEAYREIIAATGWRDEQVCFIGDDVTDLPVLVRVGLAVAAANAHEEVRKRAHYTTRSRGGHGAVREVTDLILKAQGKWHDIVARASK